MEVNKSALYVFDSNCFIEPWNKFYSYEFFEQYWDKFLKKSLSDCTVLIQEEVYNDILKKDDGLNRWLKGFKIEIVKTDISITREVAAINNKFPKLTKEYSGRSFSDPFVIALARFRKATVVTMEDFGSENKPKIPFVCDQMGVKCIDLFKYLKIEGVSFSIK